MPVASTIPFDRYLPYQELSDHIHSLCDEFPNLTELTSIGKSYEDRDIWMVTVTNKATGPDTEKPAFWIDGNIHATEVSAASACLYFIQYLLRGYGTDDAVTRCLDSRVFYIVPRLNPDGPEVYFQDKPRYLRSSTRPYPFDEDPIEGLRMEDLDGDGRILSMKVPDPNGTWKVYPDDPRMLVRRDPTETGGQYFRVLPEGMLENWDGVTIKMRRNKERLDLNRNFPAHWRPEHEQYGAGPFPTSEPEVRALVAFVSEHPNITGGVAFHTFSGVLLRPYGTQSDVEMPAEDLWTYKKIGDKGTEITGYPNVSVFHDFKYHPKEVITGVSDDWLYEHLGLFAWTVEIWSPQRQAGITDYKFIDWGREHPIEDDLKLMKWNDEVLGGKGFADWKSYDHPQLGKIEIGGWDTQYCIRNPPPEMLEKEIAQFPEWLLWHAMISPRLELHSAQCEKLGDGAHRVQVVVHNTGWLPTYVTKKALERKTAREVVAEIAIPEGAELASGKLREEIGQLEGRAYEGPTPFAWNMDSTSDRAKVEWVVRGAAGKKVQVCMKHGRAGVVRVELVCD